MNSCQGTNRSRDLEQYSVTDCGSFTFPFFSKCSSPVLPVRWVNCAFLNISLRQCGIDEFKDHTRSTLINQICAFVFLLLVNCSIAFKLVHFKSKLMVILPHFWSLYYGCVVDARNVNRIQTYFSPWRLQTSFLAWGNAHTAAQSAQHFPIFTTPPQETWTFLFHFLLFFSRLHRIILYTWSSKEKFPFRFICCRKTRALSCRVIISSFIWISWWCWYKKG